MEAYGGRVIPALNTIAALNNIIQTNKEKINSNSNLVLRLMIAYWWMYVSN